MKKESNTWQVERKFTFQQREEIIELRRSGWSYPKIAEKFNCDHTTILYHIQRAKLPFVLTTKIIKKRNKRYIKFPEPIKGKDYLDYLNDSIKDKFQLEKTVENYRSQKYLRQPVIHHLSY